MESCLVAGQGAGAMGAGPLVALPNLQIPMGESAVAEVVAGCPNLQVNFPTV